MGWWSMTIRTWFSFKGFLFCFWCSLFSTKSKYIFYIYRHCFNLLHLYSTCFHLDYTLFFCFLLFFVSTFFCFLLFLTNHNRFDCVEISLPTSTNKKDVRLRSKISIRLGLQRLRRRPLCLVPKRSFSPLLHMYLLLQTATTNELKECLLKMENAEMIGEIFILFHFQ